MKTAERARALAKSGFAVFPVKSDKTPYAVDGLKSASLDFNWVQDEFEKRPNALIAIHCGMSGIVALDIDYKTADDGTILVDGFDSLDKQWLEIPESFSYASLSGNGQHILYAAPEGKNLAPKAGYRKMAGVDRRAGESYIVFTADELPDKSLADAPEWLCDENTVRSSEQFTGTVRDWYESLEEGEPSVIVRAAMERTRKLFEERGNDLSHSDIVERQFEAVRLGSEGHSGVPQLIALIEELTLSREGAHSRTPDEYEYEFQEALASGIEKHGAAIALRAELPPFDINRVPSTVPDNLLTGTPGNKTDFSNLLRELQKATEDDLFVTSVLWNCAKTKDIAREWGLEFVHQRVLDARVKPEPTRENAKLSVHSKNNSGKSEHATNTPVPDIKEHGTHAFLSNDELESVKSRYTFIEEYLDATRTKGFTNEVYAVPAAWTILSMGFGYRAFVPLSKTLEVNTWFTVLGESTTGKGTEDRFAREVLNAMFLDGESENYNLGALSSPDGLHLGLLNRDRKPSIIHNDEAADFFKDIKTKDWMAAVPDKLAKWYDGFVEPSSKISLKDKRGMSAHTSLNQLMWGTPERTLNLMDASQFDSGYLARVNWVWDTNVPPEDRKSDLGIQEGRTFEIPPAVFDIASNILYTVYCIPGRVPVGATKAAQARLNAAADAFRDRAKTSPRWSFVRRAVDRLVMETLWKCAALISLYEGRRTFTEADALVAIYHGANWLETLLLVSESISESPYSRDVAEIEAFIRSEGGRVTRSALLYHFRGKIIRNRSELEDRINFAVETGMINIVRKDEKTQTESGYEVNG